MSMKLDLKEKRVLVTGAASGIGLATALRFQKEGAQVFTWIGMKKSCARF